MEAGPLAEHLVVGLERLGHRRIRRPRRPPAPGSPPSSRSRPAPRPRPGLGPGPSPGRCRQSSTHPADQAGPSVVHQVDVLGHPGHQGVEVADALLLPARARGRPPTPGRSAGSPGRRPEDGVRWNTYRCRGRPGQVRDDLDRRRPGADDRHPPVGQPVEAAARVHRRCRRSPTGWCGRSGRRTRRSRRPRAASVAAAAPWPSPRTGPGTGRPGPSPRSSVPNRRSSACPSPRCPVPPGRSGRSGRRCAGRGPGSPGPARSARSGPPPTPPGAAGRCRTRCRTGRPGTGSSTRCPPGPRRARRCARPSRPAPRSRAAGEEPPEPAPDHQGVDLVGHRRPVGHAW